MKTKLSQIEQAVLNLIEKESPIYGQNFVRFGTDLRAYIVTGDSLNFSDIVYAKNTILIGPDSGNIIYHFEAQNQKLIEKVNKFTDTSHVENFILTKLAPKRHDEYHFNKFIKNDEYIKLRNSIAIPLINKLDKNNIITINSRKILASFNQVHVEIDFLHPSISPTIKIVNQLTNTKLFGIDLDKDIEFQEIVVDKIRILTEKYVLPSITLKTVGSPKEENSFSKSESSDTFLEVFKLNGTIDESILNLVELHHQKLEYSHEDSVFTLIIPHDHALKAKIDSLKITPLPDDVWKVTLSKGSSWTPFFEKKIQLQGISDVLKPIISLKKQELENEISQGLEYFVKTLST